MLSRAKKIQGVAVNGPIMTGTETDRSLLLLVRVFKVTQYTVYRPTKVIERRPYVVSSSS